MKYQARFLSNGYLNSVCISLLLMLSSSFAQDETFLADPSRSALSYLRLPVSAKVAALGGAVSANINTNPSFTVLNPALISKTYPAKLEISIPLMTLDRKRMFIGGIYPFKDYLAAIGVGWISYRVEGIEERSNNGLLLGKFADQENTFALWGGFCVFENLGVGISLKYHEQKLYDKYAQGFSGDIGCFYHPSKIFTMSFVAHSLGTKFKWNTGYSDQIYPGFRLGTHTLLFREILGVSIDCEWTPGNFIQGYSGIEFNPIPWGSIMVGVQAPNPIHISGGIELSYKFIFIQYAYIYHRAELGNSHIITLGFDIGRKKRGK